MVKLVGLGEKPSYIAVHSSDGGSAVNSRLSRVGDFRESFAVEDCHVRAADADQALVLELAQAAGGPPLRKFTVAGVIYSYIAPEWQSVGARARERARSRTAN